MALLFLGVYSNIINLIGRCHSNKMLRYLYVQEEPLVRNLSWIIITHGNYSFLPHQ